MSVYRRGKTWHYQFKFAGRHYRESAKTTSQKIARAAELKRRREVEEAYNGVSTERPTPKLFSVAGTEWLTLKESTLAPKSYAIEKCNMVHLKSYFGLKLLQDINPELIARYVGHRRTAKAADKTIKLELGTLRGILKRARLWARIKQDDDGVIPKLPDRDDVGMCLTREQELALLAECGKSRSRGLYALVVLALTTGMRAGELRGLRWAAVDLDARVARVGRSKTAAGEGRPIPLNDRALTALRIWANKFPDHKSQHFVFPSERYGVAGNDADPHAHTTNTKRQMNSWRTAWETARENAGLSHCRFHDLRHTVCTRLLEGRTAFATVAQIMGWSASTTQKMAKRYGHICDETQRTAMNLLDVQAGAKKEKAG